MSPLSKQTGLISSLLLFMTISMTNSYPMDCTECIPESELPLPTSQYSISSFILTIYKHFICAPIIWKWALFYMIVWFIAKYIFEYYYYPSLMIQHYGIQSSLIKANIKLNPSNRSAIAANKFISFLAALLTVIRCAQYMYDADNNWNNNDIWNSIYIPAPKQILNLLDSFLGYFVYDTIYLLIYKRKFLFLLHHMVVPIGTIGVKSFGYGCHLGLPIFVTADATTVLLNLMWFAQDRVKYINFGIDTNNKVNNSKNKLILENNLTFWKLMTTIIQLIFGISFLYLRLGQLSYLCIPWVINVVNAPHCNLFYKAIAVTGNAALLGAGYIWSIHVMKIMYKSFKKLTTGMNKNTNNKSLNKPKSSSYPTKPFKVYDMNTTKICELDEQKTKQN